jgi:hypothetical protein
MSVQLANIKHDGGVHDVSVETEYGQCVIKFGGSFTLRVDETNLDKLREMIYVASRDLAIESRDATEVCASKPWAWEVEDQEINSSLADEMIQAGIDAREKLKAIRRNEAMMKGISLSGGWNPNDPVNW